jgi:hypothetical protein
MGYKRKLSDDGQDTKNQRKRSTIKGKEKSKLPAVNSSIDDNATDVKRESDGPAEEPVAESSDDEGEESDGSEETEEGSDGSEETEEELTELAAAYLATVSQRDRDNFQIRSRFLAILERD